MKKIQNFFSTILQKLWKSPIKAKENMEGGNNMKKRATIVLGLVLILTLVGCGNNAQSSDAHNAEYEKGYAAGYEAGYNDGKQQMTESQKHFAQFSGSFTATVEQLLPDYYALPGKTVAVVHFFQDRPFLLHFQKDLTGELIEGTAYVFEFETFEVELPDDEENPNISDYMYSINVTNYRVAEDDELGLEGKMPTVEIVSK
ncbi:hypothetical protein HMPREF9436_01612 [Faecalibacterium cf. prausnitzii KLE1255]|uniref:Uncharacterized protein n=1 Tax=Faecalibacterium cf. prausnitzii KLE1255 TaxID=748224 RepID=E2ZIW6_9FIRM|nr:hypothetical protein [Faecalibacterium prausnitzii]EFQ07015.1 hypothetical protein HMPREF9436_01612 [Faecalibacterium cf. prausnitzii KLE1255]